MSQYTQEDQQAIELARECYLIGNTGTDEAVVRFARKLREEYERQALETAKKWSAIAFNPEKLADMADRNLLLREDGYPHIHAGHDTKFRSNCLFKIVKD